MGGAAPPAPEDAPMLARMAKIGLVPGQAVRHGKARPGGADRRSRTSARPRLQQIDASKDSLGAMVNGWIITKDLGVYGTDYMKRAVVAAFGWPANLSQDAVYPYTEVDSGGRPALGRKQVHADLREG